MQEKALVKWLCCAQKPRLRKTRKFRLESREVITDGGPPGVPRGCGEHGEGFLNQRGEGRLRLFELL